jgi:PAS domain S-box-containing protein
MNGETENAAPAPERIFPLSRYFSIASFICIVVATVLLWQWDRQTGAAELRALGERNNESLTITLLNSLRPDLEKLLAISSDLSNAQLLGHPHIAKLDSAARTLVQGGTTVKIKFYNLSGRTLYSSELKQIGQSQVDNSAFQAARDGITTTALNYRDRFEAFGTTVTQRDLISTYLPAKLAGSSDTIAVVEVYDDVTAVLARMRTTQIKFLAGAAAILLLLYGTLFLIVRRADNILRQRQQERVDSFDALDRTRRDLAAAHANLDETTSQMRLVNDAVPVSLAYIDKDQRYRYINHRFEVWIERKTEDVIGRTVREIQGEEIYALIHADIERALAGNPVVSTRRQNMPSGKVLDITYTYEPHLTASGQIAGYYAVMQDVSEQQRIERTLRDSTDRFRMLTELSSDWFWEQDDKLCFVDIRGEGADHGGISADSHFGKTRWELPHTEPAEGDWEAHKALLHAHKPFKNLLLRRTPPTGVRYISVSGAPIFSLNGKFKGYRGVSSDITERRNAEETLRQATIAAESASLAKSQFLANMSHEIRTPMNGVLGMTELLMAENLTPRQQQYTTTIRNSGETLLRVINDVLDFSKIEAGKLELEILPFNLRESLDDVIALLNERAIEKGLQLELDIGDDLPEAICSDPVRLRQVLTNLTSNALKFTHQGKVRISARRVALDDARPGGKCLLLFEITDSGIGLTPEAQGKLFQPFSQADESTTRRYGGTGLGLTISKQLTELMGGEIGVRSEPSQGATFWFTISAEIALEKDAVSVTQRLTLTPADLQALSGPLNCRVLLAEDNAVNQAVAKAMLNTLGCETEIVADGVAAVEAVANRAFDVILMDCNMPRLDGWGATRQIREQEAQQGSTKHTPIIALTANAMQGEREHCIQAGMDDYLAKPFKREQLREIIARWGVASTTSDQSGSNHAVISPAP